MSRTTLAIILCAGLWAAAQAGTTLAPMTYDVSGTVEVYDSSQGLVIIDDRTYHLSDDAAVVDLNTGERPVSDADVAGRPAGLLLERDGGHTTVKGVWFLRAGESPPQH